MHDMLEMAFEVAQDAVLDTLYLIPFLFLTYLFMEWLEHKTGEQAQRAVSQAGAAGPAIGALLGVVPQCGFSAAASTLYAGRVVTMGTLLAVFLSTSDEMLPIFIAEQVPVSTLIAVLGCKVVIAMIVGFAVDAFMRARHHDRRGFEIHELCKHDHCRCDTGCETCEHNPELAYFHSDDCGADCDHEHHTHDHSHDGSWSDIIVSALRHTLQVTLFVFLVSLALNALLAVVGEQALGDFLSANSVMAVIGSAVVGLIPNCAASVAIAQLYVEGILSCGAMMSGLLCAAGVGLLVLFRANRHVKENIRIVCLLLVVSIAFGLGFDILGIVL